MFGIGGSEIIVILIVALLFLGPDKLPEATKLVSKGIRDLKRQQRLLQQTIENDEQIGGAIRDIKSALRGEEEPVRRPPVRKEPPKEGAEGTEEAAAETPTIMPPGHDAEGRLIEDAEADKPKITLPEMAGEPDLDTANGTSEGDEDLAKLIKPAAGAVAKSEPEPKPALPVTKPLSPVKPAAKLPPPRPTPLPKPAPTIAAATAAATESAASDEPETVKARPSAKPTKTDG